MGKLNDNEKQLMLDEILFYSICGDADREKILEKQEMTFDDFRRLSLIADYLELTHLHKFIWDLHAYKFIDEIEDFYKRCGSKDESIPDLIMETAHWLDDCWKNAPNDTVAFLLREVFANGLNSKKKRT